MQDRLIRYILTPLSALTQRLSERRRDQLFVCSGLGIFVYFLLYNARIVRWRYLIAFSLCCVFLGLMILASLTKDMKRVSFRPAMAVCWFSTGALMFFSGIIHNVDYLPEAVLFLVAYPILYICWNQGNPKRIFRLLLRICRYSGWIFLVSSFLFAQITKSRYGGIFENVNNCANYLSLVCVCLVVEMAYEKKLTITTVCNMILFGMCAAIINYTNSRSGQLSMLVALAAGSVFFLLTHDRKENMKLLAKLGVCAAAFSVMIGFLLYVLQLRQYLPIPYYNNVTHSFYYTEHSQSSLKAEEPKTDETQAAQEEAPSESEQPTESEVQSDETQAAHEEVSSESEQPVESEAQTDETQTAQEEAPSESEQPVESEAQTEETQAAQEAAPSESGQPSEPDKQADTTEPTFFGHESFERLSDLKNETEGKTADQFSTGRLSIWKAYLKKLTPFGVAEKEPVYIDMLYRDIHSTHMTILEIAYESGWFAGIFYFLVNVISGFTAIWYGWKNRKEDYCLMPLMVILTFGVDSVLRTTNISFHYMTTFYYYLLLFPLIARPVQKGKG